MESLSLGMSLSETASHICETAESAGAAANKAAINTNVKYNTLAMIHHFILIAIETGGP